MTPSSTGWAVVPGIWSRRRPGRSVQEIARQLVELYALRKYRQGFAYSPPDHVYREFEAGFEHEETSDQVKAIDAVLEDMASERPMDRLICGDVGFGKTEVAIRAAFKAVSDGKQVALLVPTTVLAEQHYETLKKRMAPYGVKIGIVSRFKTEERADGNPWSAAFGSAARPHRHTPDASKRCEVSRTSGSSSSTRNSDSASNKRSPSNATGPWWTFWPSPPRPFPGPFRCPSWGSGI